MPRKIQNPFHAFAQKPQRQRLSLIRELIAVEKELVELEEARQKQLWVQAGMRRDGYSPQKSAMFEALMDQQE